MPYGSIACSHCGTRLTYGTQSSGRTLTCVVCGKFMPVRGMLDGITMCVECQQKHQQQLAQEKYIEERRRQAHVNDIIARHPELKTKIMNRIGPVNPVGPFVVEGGAYEDILSWNDNLTHAKNLELAGRNEDAARVYESLGMWKEAGKARKEAGSTTIKHLSVNLNDLLDKLREGGFAVPYKCRICGAVMTIDKNSKAESLTRCAYCGTATNTDALLGIIQEALK